MGLFVTYAFKKVTTFCSCTKSLLKAKMKSFRLNPLAKEISKEPSVDFLLWLLVVTLMKEKINKKLEETNKSIKESQENTIKQVKKRVQNLNWNRGNKENTNWGNSGNGKSR